VFHLNNDDITLNYLKNSDVIEEIKVANTPQLFRKKKASEIANLKAKTKGKKCRDHLTKKKKK